MKTSTLPFLALILLACPSKDLSPVDAEADADTDADTDSDTDADADADTDADADADTDADSDADTDSDTDSDTDADINCPDDVNEPNDDVAEARPAANGYFTASSISDDFWSFTLPPGDQATVRLGYTPAFGQARVSIQNSAGTEVGSTVEGADYVEVMHTNTTTAAQSLFAVAEVTVGVCMPYSFLFSSETPPPCIDDPNEPNDSIPQSRDLVDGNGYVVSGGSPDYWRFDVVAGGEATVRATTNSAGDEVDLRLVNATNIELGTATVGPNYVEVTATNDLAFDQTFYAHVAPAVGDCIPYSLSAIYDAPVPCLPDAYEPNEDRATPSAVPSGAEMSITTDSLLDWNLINVTPGQLVTVDLTFVDATGDIDMFAYRASGGGAVASAITSGDNETLTFNATESQYVIKVQGFATTLSTGCNPYTFTYY